MPELLSMLVGLSVSASTSEPPAPDRPPPAAVQTAPAAPLPAPAAATAEPSTPPKIIFRGADGKPLPPAVQAELEARFKADPSLLTNSLRNPAERPAEPRAGEVVVSAARPRGSVIGDIPPERALDPLAIRAYGATDVTDLLQALGPQVGSGRGRADGGPVVLVNGKRVSSFAEIAKIPTEAIQRTEVFPEELALKYGYPADQKVVNLVLFEKYAVRVGQATVGVPTAGGRDTTGVTASYLRLRGDLRLDANAEYARSGSLRESERDVRPVAGAVDQTEFRTLLPASDRFALNGTVSGNALAGVSSSLNARFEVTDSRSLLGRDAGGTLVRDSDTRTAHVGTALGGQAGAWSWSLTGNYDRVSTDTRTDSVAARPGRDVARSVNAFATADLLLTGAPFTLPAGPVLTSVRGKLETRDFASRSVRGGLGQATDLGRDQGAIQASVDVPIAGRRGGKPGGLGILSANANVELARLSDFGTRRSFGYGLNWSPIAAVNLIASATQEEGAPTVEQLGAPLIATPNVRTFDFSRGEGVDVTRVFGGNPGLRADDRRVVRLGLNAKPFADSDLILNIDYIATRTSDPIVGFPVATPAIEAAFPNRFERGADGRLLRIDGRPINFARSEQRRMRWGLNYSRPLGSPPPGMENVKLRFLGQASEADLQRRYPGAQLIKREATGAAARELDGLKSRLFVSLYHTWQLQDEAVIRDGGPVLDFLNGAALGNGGGRPRHLLELQGGAAQRGLGGRLTVNWQSGTEVRGLPVAAAGVGDLRFSDVTTVNLNLFVNLDERFGDGKPSRWLRQARLSLNIANLLDSRPRVRDAAGSTPLAYQPAYLDPLGRSVLLSLRKVF